MVPSLPTLAGRRVFVTGGTGFIGRHLLERLRRDRAREVRCLTRREAAWLEPLGVRPIGGDLDSHQALAAGVEGTDVVFHLAAAKPGSGRRALQASNVDGTVNLVEAARAMGGSMPRIVVASSLAAIGPSREPVPGNAPPRPLGPYGASKAEMERRLEAYRERMPIVVVRPTAVYGPGDRDLLPLFRLASRGWTPVVTGDLRVTLLYVSDLLDGLVAAAVRPRARGATYDLASERSYSWPEVAVAFAAGAERRGVAIPVPPAAIRFLGLLGEAYGRLPGTRAEFDLELSRQLCSSWVCDISRARRDLAFTPRVDLESGVRATARWYARHGLLKPRGRRVEDRR